MGEEQTIRVIIVDEHPMVRSGLVTFMGIHDDFELAAEALLKECPNTRVIALTSFHE